MKGIRPDISLLRQNGITSVAFTRMGDPEVIPLWFGEGDRVTPEFIRSAASRALDDGETFYVHTRGLMELRFAIRSYLASLYGIEIDPDRISVPGSAMLGVTIAAQMALGPGDDALIVSPHWPNIETACAVTGAQVRTVRQRETPAGWELSASEIIERITPATKSIFVNTPCNPTGWIMTREDQQELLEHCRARSILLIADEVYHRHIFGANVAPSFLEIARDDDPVIVVNGFSKAWAMTGWRVGWVVAPVEQAGHWALMSECFNTGATVFAQRGCIAALEQGESFVQELKQQYEEAASMVVDILSSSRRIRLAPPKGAFYAFPEIDGISSSLDFVKALLAEEDVGTAPGYTFGPGNDRHMRLCFAMSHERLQEGLERLVRFTDRYDNRINVKAG